MEPMLWHRRETRRQTEKTKWVLRRRSKTVEKPGNQTQVEGRGAGRWTRDVEIDAAKRGSLVSAGNG